ncbi:hypothetical protein KM043_011134 [Ampulex compressa]|nr:hypothetical protein KM043_011134 [Ampulex compressa]
MAFLRVIWIMKPCEEIVGAAAGGNLATFLRDFPALKTHEPRFCIYPAKEKYAGHAKRGTKSWGGRTSARARRSEEGERRDSTLRDPFIVDLGVKNQPTGGSLRQQEGTRAGQEQQPPVPSWRRLHAGSHVHCVHTPPGLGRCTRMHKGLKPRSMSETSHLPTDVESSGQDPTLHYPPAGPRPSSPSPCVPREEPSIRYCGALSVALASCDRHAIPSTCLWTSSGSPGVPSTPRPNYRKTVFSTRDDPLR